VYSITYDFPSTEKYGLSSQMQRCSISIASNIAEGSSRRTSANFAHFLEIAIGSSFELETQLILAYELGFIRKEKFNKIRGDLSLLQRRLNAFRSAVLNHKDF
jgi:four helix bundle protein